METPDGLRRCTGLLGAPCERGKALAAADAQNKNATLRKAKREAEKASKDKKVRQAKAANKRRLDRELAARYRSMPLIDGGDL